MTAAAMTSDGFWVCVWQAKDVVETKAVDAGGAEF